jgi:4-hydroxy-tetrahydrodipicolinate synthase
MLGMMVNLDSWLAMEKLLLVEQGIFRNALVRGPVGYRLDNHTRAEMLRLLARLRQAVDG